MMGEEEAEVRPFVANLSLTHFALGWVAFYIYTSYGGGKIVASTPRSANGA